MLILLLFLSVVTIVQSYPLNLHLTTASYFFGYTDAQVDSYCALDGWSSCPQNVAIRCSTARQIPQYPSLYGFDPNTPIVFGGLVATSWTNFINGIWVKPSMSNVNVPFVTGCDTVGVIDLPRSCNNWNIMSPFTTVNMGNTIASSTTWLNSPPRQSCASMAKILCLCIPPLTSAPTLKPTTLNPTLAPATLQPTTHPTTKPTQAFY